MKPFAAALCAACFFICSGCGAAQPSRQSDPSPEQPAQQQPTTPTEQPEEPSQPQTQDDRPSDGDPLSSFSTPLTDQTNARVHNIILAAKAVAGVVVQPGETFSFNETVGPRTAERGYQKAKVIGHGKQIEEGLGGGVCQLSSTLYNAAANGGFPIVERHDHQVAPTYIQQGHDAAVVYGQQDFRFTNNRDYPIQLHCLVGNGRVSASITAAQ